MAKKTVTRTRVERNVVDGEFVIDHVEEEEEVSVCDICGNDEVGIDGEFQYISTLPESGLAQAAKSRADNEMETKKQIQTRMANTKVRVTLGSDSRANEVLFERTLADVADDTTGGSFTAASGLPSSSSSFNVQVTVGPNLPTPDKDATRPDEVPELDSSNSKLLCPYCFDSLFGEGDDG